MGTCFGIGIVLYLHASRCFAAAAAEIDCSSFDCSSYSLALFAYRKRWPFACRALRQFVRSSVGCYLPVLHYSMLKWLPVLLLVC